MNPIAAPATMPPSKASGIATIGGWEATAPPTATAPNAPIRNWPWAPMLKRPALKPTPTARPPSRSGVAATRELTIAEGEPNEPWISAE